MNERFPDRRIDRDGPISWPPWSPDLTPLNFFLWGYIKNSIQYPCQGHGPPEREKTGSYGLCDGAHAAKDVARVGATIAARISKWRWSRGTLDLTTEWILDHDKGITKILNKFLIIWTKPKWLKNNRFWAIQIPYRSIIKKHTVQFLKIGPTIFEIWYFHYWPLYCDAQYR